MRARPDLLRSMIGLALEEWHIHDSIALAFTHASFIFLSVLDVLS